MQQLCLTHVEKWRMCRPAMLMHWAAKMLKFLYHPCNMRSAPKKGWTLGHSLISLMEERWSKQSGFHDTNWNGQGNIVRHKARFVAKEYSQVESVDFSEAFSSVVKYATTRVMIVVSVRYKLCHMLVDVKNILVNAYFKEYIYVEQTVRFAKEVSVIVFFA